MKFYKYILLIIFTGVALNTTAQQSNGIIEGRVYNQSNNEPVPFASVVIWGTNIGSVSYLDGNFLFTGIEPGYVELRASSVGFKTYVS